MIEHRVCVNCFHRLLPQRTNDYVCVNPRCRLKFTVQATFTVTRIYTEEEIKWLELERALKVSSSD